MIRLSEKVALLPVKHNTLQSVSNVKTALKVAQQQQDLDFIFLLELNTQDAYFIRKAEFSKSEFYSVLTNQSIKYHLVDLGQAELMTRTYRKEYCFNRESLYFSFDRVFAGILNMIGLTTMQASRQLDTYREALYKVRERHFMDKIELHSQNLTEHQRLIFICGKRHASALLEISKV